MNQEEIKSIAAGFEVGELEVITTTRFVYKTAPKNDIEAMCREALNRFAANVTAGMQPAIQSMMLYSCDLAQRMMDEANERVVTPAELLVLTKGGEA